MTKAEIKTALQARYDRKYQADEFLVGDGTEHQCSVADVSADTDAMYYGDLSLSGSHSSIAGEAQLLYNTENAQLGVDDVQISGRALVPVGRTQLLQGVIFAIISQTNMDGQFIGYKFPVTRYQTNVDGSFKFQVDGVTKIAYE